MPRPALRSMKMAPERSGAACAGANGYLREKVGPDEGGQRPVRTKRSGPQRPVRGSMFGRPDTGSEPVAGAAARAAVAPYDEALLQRIVDVVPGLLD